ncbi:hypothetical protein DOTSEDRAFT_87905 [Dothistroma septosporum NZE10]|uniref:Fe2OG dioxygenase domain-containing protein n=1 Tax=Dothistroma septosporum (strain NZE10 / CBS 128990) TaxID=675120 RepID=N1PT58_DOTSN|nr:hypothetical protein DOTSEDRAFT_87905 [Dothistroma septosporum NZE10]
MAHTEFNISILGLLWAEDPLEKLESFNQLRSALFDISSLYIVDHGIEQPMIDRLAPSGHASTTLCSTRLLDSLPDGLAEETTLGKQDLREQFDLAPELPVALIDCHDAVQSLSFRFVNLIEEVFNIPVGPLDHFSGLSNGTQPAMQNSPKRSSLPPQHRVGAHKDSSGWLAFLYQVGNELGLEVLLSVVNFGNASDAATAGAVKATIHGVTAPRPSSNSLDAIPFFQGLPLVMTVAKRRTHIPQKVRRIRSEQRRIDDASSSFLDPRWDSLEEANYVNGSEVMKTWL